VFFVDAVVEGEDIPVHHGGIIAPSLFVGKGKRLVIALFLIRSMASKKRGAILPTSARLQQLDHVSEQKHADDEEHNDTAQLHSLS